MADYDSPWKEMLDGYFPAFMAFFFPEAHADIDWTRGYESLDTDLQQIVRDAALGTRLTIKTLDSEEAIEVKSGTQPASTLRIRGKGVPHLRGQGRGDLFVHLDVKTPTKLTAEQERMLREFAKTRGEDVAELSKQGGFFSRMRDAFNGH